MARILVVDGNKADRLLLCAMLEGEEHEVSSEASGQLAFRLLNEDEFDLVLSASDLPDMTGLEVTQQVRRNPELAPVRVLIISAANSPSEMANALESGADDYLAKPVEREVLVARVNAALRRPAALAPDGFVRVGPITLAKASHMVQVGNQELRLSPVEFRLMSFFMENPGRVHDRQELLAKVWRRKNGICERTVDVHVRRLRASLEPYNCEHMLKTVRGFGYRFG